MQPPRGVLHAILVAVSACAVRVHAVDTAPLTIEFKIPLGQIGGRIDHLAFDPGRRRVYVAELGNNSIGIIDFAARRVMRTVEGFDEPQGIGYEPSTDTVYVASAGDGSARIFKGADFTPLANLPLGGDADNVRIDAKAQRVYVGYGAGALAVIDPVSRKLIKQIPLQGHPESFQLDPAGDSIFVNVPDANEIAVVARASGEQVASWSTGSLHANFPLAIDAASSRVMGVFRRPARLQAFDMRSGKAVAGSEVCADSDDVFVDPRRQRVYVICGQGYVDVLDAADYRHIGRFTTSRGSRTGLYVPELDRLLVAIRATATEPAAVWILKPKP